MSRFCVAEGTMITLKDKTRKPIEEIIIGEELLVFDLETLQKSQKYNILIKMSTNDFRGIFQDSVVKNIWTNTSEKYYLINNKLKITGDHILLANRDDRYYWTKVEKLEIGDLLFTELNIFEYIKSIEIVNDKIDVYNLEVNNYYNYFANSYLIHNGAPCTACGNACGSSGGNVLLKFSDQFGIGGLSASIGSGTSVQLSSSSWTTFSGVSSGAHTVSLVSGNGDLVDAEVDFTSSPSSNFSSQPAVDFNASPRNSEFNFTVTAFDVNIIINIAS